MLRTSTEPATSFDRRIGFALRRAYQRASGNLAASLQGSGLTVPRFSVLLCLSERGPLPQNRLGRLVAMEPGNIHGIVRALTKAGLVRTDHDPGDRRRRLVALTGAGAALLARVQPPSAAANAATLSPLSEAERRMLFALLERIGAPGD